MTNGGTLRALKQIGMDAMIKSWHDFATTTDVCRRFAGWNMHSNAPCHPERSNMEIQEW